MFKSFAGFLPDSCQILARSCMIFLVEGGGGGLHLCSRIGRSTIVTRDFADIGTILKKITGIKSGIFYDVNKLLHELKCPAISFEMTPFGAVKPYILHSSLSWLEFSIF